MLHKFLIRSGNLFFKFRNVFFPIIILSFLLFIKPGLFLNNQALDKFVVTAGFIIALLGTIFRSLVIGFAYVKRGGKGGCVYADHLVIKGFYAHVRNPMYIGNFLILTGMGIIYGSIYYYLMVIPLFSFIYFSIVVTEENYLKKHFGKAYEEYCKSVPRFLPNFRGIRKSLSEFRYDWRKVIRKDYGTFFGTIIECYAILLWKNHLLYGFPANKNELTFPAVVFLLIAVGYSTARYLKKSGRLR